MSRSKSLLTWFLVYLSLSGVWAQNCVITVPANPLTLEGLAQPWIQTGCTQLPMTVNDGAGNPGTASFFQAAILDLGTGNMFTYTPLVLDAAAATANTQQTNVAAIPPALPTFMGNAISATNQIVVGILGGTNGASVNLVGTMTPDPNTGAMISSLTQGNCVNGGGQTGAGMNGAGFSIFGQYTCCNCRQFMDQVFNLIHSGTITLAAANTAANPNQIPALGNDFAQNLCPTTHDFAIVDQDPSDNVPGKYLSTANGQLAQSTVPNKAKLTAAKTTFIEFDDGSDETVVGLVQMGIGCTPFMVLDAADPTGQTFFPNALLQEVQALALAPSPKAFIEANDPMVLDGNGKVDVNKLNAYRNTIGQSTLNNAEQQAGLLAFCTNLYVVGAPKIAQWLPNLVQVAAPDFGAGVSNTLGGVLVGRFGVTVNNAANGGMLGCTDVLGKPNPFAKFSGVGAGGPLVCPAPNFNPMDCTFVPSATVTTIAQALGVADLTMITAGETTFDIPFPPGSPVFV